MTAPLPETIAELRRLEAKADDTCLFRFDDKSSPSAIEYIMALLKSAPDLFAAAARGVESEAEIARLVQKLDDDSLDAIVEVVGEGPEFATYNRGKSAMRDWFLRRLRAALQPAGDPS